MLVILLFSLVADLIEKSRIPKWYYYVLVISIVIPLVIGMFFVYIYGGNLSWMKWSSFVSTPLNDRARNPT